MVTTELLWSFHRTAKNVMRLNLQPSLIPSRRIIFATAVLSLITLTRGSADPILSATSEGSNVIDDAFHARQYGGLFSNNKPVAIALDSNDNIYIEGNTAPRTTGGIEWGSTEPGVYCAGNDIFLAGLGTDGALSWVRRFGTAQQDAARAMVIVDDAMYVYGGTYGLLGGANQGESDAFISKFSLSGSEIWSYQLVSNAADECSAIAVGKDDGSGYRSVYIAGEMAGMLFGSGTLANNTTYRYVARFMERPQPGLRL
jgi:hypothetical protein